jgi:FkbM family methyltransferase
MQLSYAQNLEDYHLDLVFAGQDRGTYVDVGGGHPVADNVSFWFYLAGWRGLIVEPQKALADIYAHVRPRDHAACCLAGRIDGEAEFHVVDKLHGFSTTVREHAAGAEKFGAGFTTTRLPVRTLSALIEEAGLARIDFLKIDVEGAEKAVLLGNDWWRFRPKVILAEALAPVTLKPAWAGWEPILLKNGYQFVLFDGLNRYYVAEEHAALGERLAAAPRSFRGTKQFHRFKPALQDASHVDHRLARLLDGTDMVRLPVVGRTALLKRLTAHLTPTDLDRKATPADAAAIARQLFGTRAPGEPRLHRSATIRDLYAAAIASERFRAACGRISASYAW